MYYKNPDFDNLMAWLETEAIELPGMVETIPERRACLRALEDLSVFFEKYPDVEILGMDRVDGQGFDHLRGQYSKTDGVWIDCEDRQIEKDFSELMEHFNRCLMERPDKSVDFCLERVFIPDPGGDFGFFISRSGMGRAVKNCLSLNTLTLEEDIQNIPEGGTDGRKVAKP